MYREGTYIFVAKSTDRPEHFKNFEIGGHYEFKSITSGMYEPDSILDVQWNSPIVVFSNTNYAVFDFELDKYFISLDNYRETILNQLYL